MYTGRRRLERACRLAFGRPICFLGADNELIWQAHATPLLYASLILDSRADDEGCFLDQPKSRSGMAPEADRRRALIQLLQERPDLAALVREVDFPSGQIEQFAAPFWSLIRTVRFSDASVTDLGSLALGYARKVVLPTSFALQRLAFTSFAQRPAKLADWVNLTNLARLDIMTSGDSYWLMDAFEDASLPNLIDLRIVTIQQSNDWSHAEAVLAIFGKQLQRFHFFDLSGRRPSMNIIMIRCPNLRELALNSHLIPLFGPGHEPPAVWALDRLLYGPPWVKPAGRPALEPSNRKDVSAAVAYYRPRRLALASLDGNMLTDVDREYARHLLNNLRIETGNTDLILEDRFGRTIVAD